MRKVIYLGVIVIVSVVIVGVLVLKIREKKAVETTVRNEETAAQTSTVPSIIQATSTPTTEAFDQRLKAEYEIDRDLDGIKNEEEARLKTNPDNPDSDGDGILDNDEITIYKTNPLKADTDNDGTSDGREATLGRDPLKKEGATNR